jgi:hypothetical protein
MVHDLPPAAGMVSSRDAIVVIGMGRSGTSALARVLSLCGGTIPFPLLPSNFANPTGFWEPAGAVALNDAFLASRGSSFFDANLALQLEPLAGPERSRFTEQIAAFLEPALASGGPLVLKEPRITVLLPYWVDALTFVGLRPVFVHIVRNPVDVAASLAARDGLPLRHALLLWLKYNLIGERDARGAPRAFVSYEALMHDWEAVVGQCSAQIGAGLEVGSETRTQVAEFLSPQLRHHDSSTLDAAALDPAITEWVSVTHALLQQGCDTGFRTALLDQVLSDLAAWIRAHRPAVDVAAIRAYWETLVLAHAEEPAPGA